MSVHRAFVIITALWMIFRVSVVVSFSNPRVGGRRSATRQTPAHRELLQSADSDSALQTYLETASLLRDEKTCYNVGELVAIGRPMGCGRGCQFVSEVTGFSTEYVNQGVLTSTSIIGPPDVYPRIKSDRNAWTPALMNNGNESIQFRIAQPVYVSGMELYETYHPGAVIKIEGRLRESSNSPSTWVVLWEGPTSVPDGSGIYNRETGQISSTARVFRPTIIAPRSVRLNEFRVSLDTLTANGYNEIDAIKVLGDDLNGMQVDDHFPLCSSVSATNCWYSCTSDDVLTNDRFLSTLDVVSRAISWLGISLKVAPVDGNRLFIQAPKGTDPEHVRCDDVQVPSPLTEQGVAYGLVLFVTARPVELGELGPTDRTLPVAKACRFDESMRSLGRPLAVHLNLPARYAEEASLTGTAAARDATDGVIHHLYRALGWGPEYHTQFMAFPEQSVVSCLNAPDGCASAVDDTRAVWSRRNIQVLTTPKVRAKASEHFGQTVDYVELENGGGAGVKGVLLEDRIFYGEVMTFPAPGKRLHRSAISLALLEDTGWYFPDYSVAEPLMWGHSLGEEFVLNQCNFWPSGAKYYVCPTLSIGGTPFDLQKQGEPGCTGDRLAKGVCTFLEYPTPLPSPFQYFRLPDESNFGGTDPMRDYCPFNQARPDGGGLCSDITSAGEYYEDFGDSSRCFDVTWKSTTAPGCLRHRCIEGKLWIKLGSEYQECPLEGGSVSSVEAAVSVLCPRATTMCDGYSAIPPAVMVNQPVTNAVYNTPFVTASFEFANFRVPRDGALHITVGGRILQIWNGEGIDESESIKLLQLRRLPQGRLVLGFHLIDTYGNEIDVQKVIVNVVASVQEWVTSVASFSSQDPARIASNVIGPNTTHVYATNLGSWSPSRGGAGLEFLEVRLRQPVHARSVEIYENFSPGSLRSVAARLEDGRLEPLWAGHTAPGELRPVLGSNFAPTQVSTRSGAALDVITDTFRLEFHTPSWVEVNAVKVIGVLWTPPEVTVVGQSPSLSVLRANHTTRHVITLQNHGTGTLFWELEDVESYPSWVVPIYSTGEQFGLGQFRLEFDLDASQVPAGSARSSIAVTLLDTYGVRGTSLVSVDLVLLVDFTVHSTVNPAACYNGVVVGASDVRPGVCTCHSGAYGIACEFLRCPNNCSALQPEALGQPAVSENRGICDASTGVCQCNSGYSGIDCSGQDGDCYLSYDGTCRPGFAPGSYVLNTADSGNLNKGSGDLPSSMQCNEGKEDSVFGCSTLVHMQFCCRAAAPPRCPFFLGSAPCVAARAEECISSYATDPECLGVVHQYCFDSPEDPACNAFRPLRVPADFCPLSLAMEWCAAHPDGEECSSVFTKVSNCMFTEYDGWSPCTMPVCRVSVLSDECTPWVVSHCQQHPEDRECDLYGFGDGCMFRPGAPPCQASVCNVLPDAYNQESCDDIIQTYCNSLVGGVTSDPECAAQGYGGPPPEAVPVRTSCPWSAIEMQCRESPTSPLCVRMHAAGVNMSDPTAGTLPSVAMLQPQIQQQELLAADTFAEVGILRELDRRSGRCAADLAVQLWRIANTNNDSALTQDELDMLIKAATVMLQLDRRFDETPSIAVMHDMLQTISYGEYVTYNEFVAFVDAFFVINC